MYSHFQDQVVITGLVGYLDYRIRVKVWFFFPFFACLLLNLHANLVRGSWQTLYVFALKEVCAFDLEKQWGNWKKKSMKWPRKLKTAHKIILIKSCFKVHLYTIKVTLPSVLQVYHEEIVYFHVSPCYNRMPVERTSCYFIGSENKLFSFCCSDYHPSHPDLPGLETLQLHFHPIVGVYESVKGKKMSRYLLPLQHLT